MNVRRFNENPIIQPHMDTRMGANINGPSLIRVPDWVDSPLGQYYLYFAHHEGAYIRMAYADQLAGPWKIYGAGVLELADSHFDDHIASPDVHIIEERREIRMYYHGCDQGQYEEQFTRVATSGDGLGFSAHPDVLGNSYWRAFRWDNYWYTLEMPGTLRRSRDGMTNFEQGPMLFTADMRHAAVDCEQDTLHVYYSNAGDCPESILWSAIQLTPDWHDWSWTAPQTLLRPELNWEGADCPVVPSVRGSVHRRVNQLRDPCIFKEAGETYLLYSVAGEAGIAIAELSGTHRFNHLQLL